MKIDISYGRKVPGSQDYSSESLHITITQDLGNEPIDDNELKGAINALYAIVKTEVDKRLPATAAQDAPPTLPSPGANGHGHSRLPNGNGNGNGRTTFPNNHGDHGRPPQFAPDNGNRVLRVGNGKASPKQVNYLLSLANKRGVTFEQLGQYLEQQTGKRDPYELSTGEASRIIDGLKG